VHPWELSGVRALLLALSPPGLAEAETVMSNVNKRVVQHRPDGKVEVRAPGSERASAVVGTQADGISRAREILANAGGGELQVRGTNGQIRKQDTIAPGNDPRQRRG